MNKRNYSRVPFRITAVVTAGQRSFSGDVDNLSMNGMFLETTEHLPEQTHTHMSLLLVGPEPEIRVEVDGVVRRCDDRGIAFQFDGIDLESFTHLRNIIAFNIADPDKVLDEITGPHGAAE